MTILPLLTCAAVPFAFPEHDSSIAARRYRSARLRRQFRNQADVQQQVDQHLLMTTVLTEAELAFQTVLDPRRDESVPSAKTPVNLIANPLPPPNSPNDSLTFDFPEPSVTINPDPFPTALPISSSEEEDEKSSSRSSTNGNLPAAASAIGLRRRRSLRKRRRVPSFKNKQTPRVEPKFQATEGDYADDEASDSEEEKMLAFITHATSQINTKDESGPEEPDFVPTSELQLKLQVLSEVQKAVESSGDEGIKSTDWAKVGLELRQIADKFSDDHMDELDGQVGTLSPMRGGFDLISMIDLMLPFSVPHSLWSALVSYAAWKIFKRFQ